MIREEIIEIRTIDLLHALSNARPIIATFKRKEKPYNALIDAILAFPERGSDESPPNGQDLQKLLTITSATLRKWALELYDDLLRFIGEQKPIAFTKYKVDFAIHGYKGRSWIATELTTLPRLGEEVSFPFLYPVVGGLPLFVERIEYTYENDTVRILITIGHSSPYLIQLKQRADFEKRFHQFDLATRLNLSDSDERELLDRWYGRG